MTTRKTTTNHAEIKRWAERRGGHFAKAGILRIDFPGFSGDDQLEEVGWDAWFKTFDDRELAFLYQETTADGEESRFNKLVSRHGDK